MNNVPVVAPVVEKKKRVYKRKTVTVEDQGSASTATANQVPPPPIVRELFPHQVDSVFLMERAEAGAPIKDPDTGFDTYCSYGTLENPVGSGKTTVMLQVIKNDKLKFETTKTMTILSGKNKMLTGDPSTMYADPTTGFVLNQSVGIALYPVALNIVVCSKPLTTVWHTECEAMGVPSVVIDAPKHVDGREQVTKMLSDLLTKDMGVLIVTNNLYGLFMGILDDILRRPVLPPTREPEAWRWQRYITPKRLIMDDIHSATKWSKSYCNIAPLFTWVINSTPSIIPWGRIESYLATDFLTRPPNQRYQARDNGHVVKVAVPERTYVEPGVVLSKFFYKRNETARLLADHIPLDVKLLLDSGDFDGAYRKMKDLAYSDNEDHHLPHGDEEDEGDSMVISERKPLQDLVIIKYQKQLHTLNERKVRLINADASTESVDVQIQDVERKIASLQERLKAADAETTECPICCDDVDRGGVVATKCCHNFFCKDCIGRVFAGNKLCPLCRQKIGPLDLYSLQGDGKVFDISQIVSQTTKQLALKAGRNINEQIAATPMDALYRLVSSKPRGSKFVAFCPTEGSSKAYKEFFKSTDYVLQDLVGSAATIRNRLDGFKNGNVDVLFLSSKSSNAGLNLQFATDVVIINNSPELDLNDGFVKQSVGRVRRFPRTEVVPVHHITVSPY